MFTEVTIVENLAAVLQRKLDISDPYHANNGAQSATPTTNYLSQDNSVVHEIEHEKYDGKLIR